MPNELFQGALQVDTPPKLLVLGRMWNSTTYNVADQPTAVAPSAGGSESFVYDGNSGRMTQWTSTAGSKQQIGTLTWNANGTLQTMAITDTASTGNAQTCNYLYDDLERLLSANCGMPWSQTFTYDYFGNIWKSGSSAWTPASYTNNWASNIVYDITGNALNDGANTYTYDAEAASVANIANGWNAQANGTVCHN